MTSDEDPIEPDRYPTPQEWAKAVADLKARLMTERPRTFPTGTVRKCPVCLRRTLESRDDLLREMTTGATAVVHHNLHGARCKSCGTELLEAYEEVALEEGASSGIADYHAKVTSVSGRNLGTYWPKDVVRVMDLHNQDELRVQVLDPDTMIIQRTHASPAKTKRRRAG